ncbi:hypothetical protein [Scytonema sp. PRP1]|uniref:hypothetical protein n=1 Tax=Scytonema sp. PRP1 TaxID=3120513 RepID=UPI00300C0D58
MKPAETDKLGYNLEVIVLEQTVPENEPLWKTRLMIIQGASIQIAIEVASTNWRNDYGHKFIDYGAL